MTLSTHVLDTAKGRPAVGVQVRLETRTGDGWQPRDTQHTDADGRVRAWHLDLEPGTHRLVFDTAAYLGADAFFPEVAVAFQVGDADEHYHVPLLLSPFGYSTYRGS